MVTQDFSSRLPIQLDKLVLVTSSFAFARLACCCLGRSCHSWFDVLRVTHYSRCLPVGQQSSEFVARLDQHWSKPPGVLAEAYCQLCVESYRSDPHAEVTWLLNGVNVFNEPTIECGERLSDTSPAVRSEHTQQALARGEVSSCSCCIALCKGCLDRALVLR